MHESFGGKSETSQKSIFEQQILWGSKQSLSHDCKVKPLFWLMEFFHGNFFLIYVHLTIPCFTAPSCSCKLFWAHIKCWSFCSSLLQHSYTVKTKILCPLKACFFEFGQQSIYVTDSVLRQIPGEKFQQEKS